MDEQTKIQPLENPVETMRKTMAILGHHDTLSEHEDPLKCPHLVAVPEGRKITDLTRHHIEAMEFLKPLRRKGTARLDSLESFIGWAERFSGETSVLYALPDMNAPKLTCIADYHDEGGATIDGADPAARHCHHLGVYNFPLSEEWKAWTGISGQPLGKDEMGEFIEAQAKDIMDPTPAILAGKGGSEVEPWEARLVETARQIEGRYGQLTELLAMSKRFQVYETSDLTVKTNRDSGEAEIQFMNEHRAADGKPLKVPNLIIIAIPVFKNGAPYRMPVRFRYRKSGSEVRFILSIYNPERAFQSAFDEAVTEARDATGLPTFLGAPEA